MQGIVKDGKLIITIDVSPEALKNAQPSGSGKTLLVASSHGFARFDNVSVSLNATVPNPNYKKTAKAA